MSWQLKQILPDTFASAYHSDSEEEEEAQYCQEEADGDEAAYYGQVLEHNAHHNTANNNNNNNNNNKPFEDVYDDDAGQHEQYYFRAASTGTTSGTKDQTTNHSDPQINRPMSRRQRQRKRQQANHAADHTTVESRVAVLPRVMRNPYERFFASLLRSTPQEYAASNNNNNNNNNQFSLWTDICHRVRLQPLLKDEPIQAKYSDPREHFAVRAALVLEESRCAIAEGLAKRWVGNRNGSSASRNNNNNNKKPAILPRPSKATMHVQCIKATDRNPETDRSDMTFQLSSNNNNNNKQSSNHNNDSKHQQQKKFTKEQLFQLRPGTVVEILPTKTNAKISNNIEHAILGCIAFTSRDEMERDGIFSVMLFRDLPFREKDGDDDDDHPIIGGDFAVTPVAGLISELRQFEACVHKNTPKVLFVNALMGHWPKHIRFQDSDDDEEEEEDDDSNDSENITLPGSSLPEEENDGIANSPQETSPSAVALSSNNSDLVAPPLNRTQEKAAHQFLNSSPGSITLVQGPPGTGKSTMLVSTICRYLLAARNKSRPRLMVSAPTNKAVTVVASRFLNVLGQNNPSHNVIMVGDADKLLDGDPKTTVSGHVQGQQQPSHLRSIFLYSWMSQMIDEYKRLRQSMALLHLESESDSVSGHCGEICDLACRLYQRLVRSLPISTQGEISKLAKSVWKDLKSKRSDTEDATEIDIETINELIELLSDLSNEDVCRELLTSANIIFCTLATSGAKLFKWTSRIDDLIVDEASAATESELYVPFHMKPRRLLVVGDPNQLPATVMSTKAKALGYDKSLHERLMNDCHCSYIMLDIQYRMNPGISSFPSRQFYNNKIKNGPNVLKQQYRSATPLLCGKPYYFLQVDGDEEQAVCGSYRNHAEANRVVDLIQDLRAAAAVRDSNWHVVDRVRIITFYRAQVVLVQQLLNSRGLSHVLVATVDSSQGCESDLVIVSFVRSNTGRIRRQSSSHFLAGFLNDDRRMNVALTRAKHQLICVGNIQAMTTLVPSSTLHGLASNAEARRCVVVDGATSLGPNKRRKSPQLALPCGRSKKIRAGRG